MAEAKKRSFDAAFKLKVLGYAELHSNRAAARYFGVDEMWVREWSAIVCASVSARGRGQSSHECWGRGGKWWKSGGQNKRCPRINAALEKTPHFREAEINSSCSY